MKILLSSIGTTLTLLAGSAYAHGHTAAFFCLAILGAIPHGISGNLACKQAVRATTSGEG
jgi:hypothetical protein